ncbi:2Fe-2S iron-sulfur cluster-binding protein [Azohydromonas lata]|uniref:2Fe-2S iron-sulfur cluster-binding protein n=1 Tax=Azohydromonas lata TaxID=45677 RepID=UPI0027D8F3A7|nr:2Fe-2S iron-sulfur cluster binding domain-containing protein [Azohydromonas lata]
MPLPHCHGSPRSTSAARLDVQPGANLLEVLREHQLPPSYSCTAGRCGTCRCRVGEGEVMDGGAQMQRPRAADPHRQRHPSSPPTRP